MLSLILWFLFDCEFYNIVYNIVIISFVTCIMLNNNMIEYFVFST